MELNDLNFFFDVKLRHDWINLDVRKAFDSTNAYILYRGFIISYFWMNASISDFIGVRKAVDSGYGNILIKGSLFVTPWLTHDQLLFPKKSSFLQWI